VRTVTRYILPIAVLAGVVFGVRLLRGGQPPVTEATVAPPSIVTVAEVQRRDLPLTISAVGRAEAKASVAVKSRLDGQIAELVYAEGQPVRKGQLLLRIDPSLLEAQQRQAEAILARDQAQLAKAQDDYQRNVALKERGFISLIALTQSESDLHAAEASVRADRATLDSTSVQLAYARISAPMDGIAGAVLLPVGSSVKANDSTLVVINQVSPIYISFPLPETQLIPVKTAMQKGPVKVTASIPGMVQPVTGKLAFIDNGVDTTSGTILAKALFANADAMLTPGQYAEVAVQLDTLPNALAVPSEAIESGIDGPYAFVVSADSTVALRRVAIGPATGAYRVVTSGLSVGEHVVTSGQARLRDKSRVAISASAAADPASP
jgi:multidrug efflux system membrane fusion protein